MRICKYLCGDSVGFVLYCRKNMHDGRVLDNAIDATGAVTVQHLYGAFYMVRFALRGSAVVQKMPAQYDGDEIVRGGRISTV